jgi:nicotinamidase-related amidase
MIDKHTALILIDVQMGLNEARFGERYGGDVEGNLLRLLAAWRERGMPIFHVQHSSTEPNSPLRPELAGFAFKAGFEPAEGETHLVKQVNSAFIGTDLEAQLRAAQIETVVLGGLTTNHCVSTSTRMAGNLGFETFLVRDGVAAFAAELDGELISAELIHKISLANLNKEFATLIDTDTLLSTL